MAGFPILDLEREPPKQQRSWKTTLVAIFAAAALLSWIPIDSVLCLPALILSVAVHEIGHLVAGKLVGMRVGGVMICGLTIIKSGARWRCRFDYRRLLAGGVAQPLPKKGDFDRVRYAWMVAGGPAATLLLAAVSLPLWRMSGNAIGWASSCAWVNAVLLGCCLIPMSSGPNKSDGARLWMLLRHPDESKSWMALLHVIAQDSEGVLPRDWDPELVAQMLDGASAAEENSYRQMLAFYRRADEGNDAAALEHLENALSACGRGGTMVRHWCFLEAASASALLRGNASAARTWLERAVKLRKPRSRHGVEAAIAQCEGRYAEALQSWDAALAFVARTKLDSGMVRCGRERITFFRDQCLAAIRSSEQPGQESPGVAAVSGI